MKYTKSRWTPFAGKVVHGKVNRVVLRNKLAFIDGKVSVIYSVHSKLPPANSEEKYIILSSENEVEISTATD